AAGVGGERDQRLLLVVEALALLPLRLPAEDPAATRGVLAGIASGRRRGQTARVDGIERHVRAFGGVDGGAELRLILDAGLAHAAGEINESLLLRQSREHLGGGFERAQL